MNFVSVELGPQLAIVELRSEPALLELSDNVVSVDVTQRALPVDADKVARVIAPRTTPNVVCVELEQRATVTLRSQVAQLELRDNAVSVQTTQRVHQVDASGNTVRLRAEFPPNKRVPITYQGEPVTYDGEQVYMLLPD